MRILTKRWRNSDNMIQLQECNKSEFYGGNYNEI